VTGKDGPEDLLDLLAGMTGETIQYVPGFVSANLRMTLERTRVVNYAQWHSREATASVPTANSSRPCTRSITT
jgi:hypothetical protein